MAQLWVKPEESPDTAVFAKLPPASTFFGVVESPAPVV